MVQSQATTGGGRANKMKGTSLTLPIRAKTSVHWLAFLYAWTTCRFGNFFKRSLQSVSKGSRERLVIEFFIRCTTARASSSTIRLYIFSITARCNPSRRAHSSAITLFSFPQFLANPLIQVPCAFLNKPPPPPLLVQRCQGRIHRCLI